MHTKTKTHTHTATHSHTQQQTAQQQTINMQRIMLHHVHMFRSSVVGGLLDAYGNTMKIMKHLPVVYFQITFD